MFTILAAKENDLSSAKKWFEEQAIEVNVLEELLPFIMFLRVEETIMGYIAYVFNDDDTCVLTQLYVCPQIRGHKYGDTLVRSVMNLLSRRGFDVLLAKRESAFSEFLVHFGFDNAPHEDYLSIPSIDAFFKQPCKGSKG